MDLLLETLKADLVIDNTAAWTIMSDKQKVSSNFVILQLHCPKYCCYVSLACALILQLLCHAAWLTKCCC